MDPVMGALLAAVILLLTESALLRNDLREARRSLEQKRARHREARQRQAEAEAVSHELLRLVAVVAPERFHAIAGRLHLDDLCA